MDNSPNAPLTLRPLEQDGFKPQKALFNSREFHINRIMSATQDHSPILQTAFAFWSSKVLLTAVEMGVFTRLADRPLTGAELGSELELHPRGIKDFFDALVAMKFL